MFGAANAKDDTDLLVAPQLQAHGVYNELIYVILLVAATMSAGLTRVLLSCSGRLDLLVVPNHRSSHRTPTPTAGGVSFVIVSVGYFLTMSMLESGQGEILISFLVPATFVALLGYLDDRTETPAPIRLVVQLLLITLFLVLWAVSSQLRIPIEDVPGVLFAIIYIGLLMWLLNLFNFMDGIDGIAGVEAITVSVGAALIISLNGSSYWVQHLLVLTAAIAGFLISNWPPAKIFMGDVGSGFLGFMLGAFALLTAADGVISLWSWVVLLAVFVADATVTLLRRAVRGERVYEAHRSHAYQILSRRWNSHLRVTLLVLAVNLAWLWPIAWAATNWPQQAWLLAIVAYVPLVVVVYMIGAGTTND